jgi:hypothetical protein
MAKLTEIPKSLVEPVEPRRRMRERGLQAVLLGVARALELRFLCLSPSTAVCHFLSQ